MQNGATSLSPTTEDRHPFHHAATRTAYRVLGVYSRAMPTETWLEEQLTPPQRWLVRRIDDETYCTQALNANDVPSGPLTAITKGEFIRNYRLEPGYYEKRCLPFIDSLNKKMDQAERCLTAGNLDGAKKAFGKALLLDAQNPRANIGLGHIALQRESGKKLAATLRRLLTIETLFQGQERQQLNAFAIRLRKAKRYAEALAFYAKALKQNEADENLHFNVARTLAEAGKIAAAKRHVRRALELHPDFPQAHRLLHGLERHEQAIATDTRLATLQDDTSSGERSA